MRYSNFPAYTITGTLSANTELSCRGLLLTNTSGSAVTVTIAADVWLVQNQGTRDTTEYGDYDNRTYKSVTFSVQLAANSTTTLPIALKKVTTLTNAGNALIYVLM